MDFFDLFPALLFPLLMAFAFFWYHARSSRKMVDEWAKGHRYELLSIKGCLFFCGPFGLSRRGYSVYYVTVKTRQGRIKEGWVRCNITLEFLFQLLPKRKRRRIEVRWKT